MSEKVKLIVTLSKGQYEALKDTQFGSIGARMIFKAVQNGVPLDDDSDRAEVQAYFAGQAYGWEEGRKALIDDVKEKIETDLSWDMFDEYGNETGLHKELMEILDNIGKAESEE